MGAKRAPGTRNQPQFHEETLAMNEALLLGSVRQHELAETAENLNAQLRAEIDERKRAEAATRAKDDFLGRTLP